MLTSRFAVAFLVMAVGVACDRPRFREVEVSLAPPPAPADIGTQPGPSRALRFSVAAVESPRDTYADYSHLFLRMGEKLGMPIEFVQRRTYREVNDLLASGALDAALVCTGGYLDLRQRGAGPVEVLAVPVVDGEQTYRSLVVVAADGPFRDLNDLAGKRFAYTDELSFSGRAWARRLLLDRGLDPDRFFGSTIYTRSHDRSVAAVVQGLVDGAAVHSVVFARLVQEDPALARQVRVIHRSPPFGAMPVVASPHLPASTRARLRQVLLDLADDPQGRAELQAIGVDRFAVPRPGLYDSAALVVEGRR
jgi:phosphonate transport system substrate-binding protein